MLQLTLEHELDCTPERFWTLFFDVDFTHALIVDGLGFSDCSVDPPSDHGENRTRSMKVTPKLELPARVAKVLGPKLSYTETGVFDARTRQWSYDVRVSVLSERIKLRGEVTLKPLGTDRAVRISNHAIDVRILGLGGLLERAAESNVRDGWAASARWMNQWFAQHPPSA